MLKKHTLRMFSDSLSRMRDADLSEMSNTRGVGAKLKLNGGPRTRKQTPSVLICKKAQYGSLERQVIIIIKKNTKIRTNLFSLLQKCVKKGNIFKGPFSLFPLTSRGFRTSRSQISCFGRSVFLPAGRTHSDPFLLCRFLISS